VRVRTCVSFLRGDSDMLILWTFFFRKLPQRQTYIHIFGVIFSSSGCAVFLYTRDYFTFLMELGCVHFTRVNMATVRLEI